MREVETEQVLTDEGLVSVYGTSIHFPTLGERKFFIHNTVISDNEDKGVFFSITDCNTGLRVTKARTSIQVMELAKKILQEYNEESFEQYASGKYNEFVTEYFEGKEIPEYA